MYPVAVVLTWRRFTKVMLHTELLHTGLVYIESKNRQGDFLVERREVSSRVISHVFSHISVVLMER